VSKRLPTITSNIPRDLRTFVDRLRELVSGGGENRLLSVKDLTDAGLAATDSSGNVVPVPSYVSTPPAPENVTATPAIRNVIVEWDALTYTGHAYSEVWGSSTNDLGAAVLLGQTPGYIYTDALGPGATRYYWVRNVNTKDEFGPYNAVSGTVATTGGDLAYTMGLLRDTYGGSSEAPFFQLNTSTVINGVTIPAGTYMKAAFIHDAEITNAKIANLAVDSAKLASAAVTTAKIGDAQITTAKIVDANITTAKIANAAITTALIGDAQITTAKIGDAQISNAKIGDTIQSNNFSSGSAGWRILKSGSAEFNGPVISRNIVVASGTYAAWTTTTGFGTYVGNYLGYNWYEVGSQWIDTGFVSEPWGATNSALIFAAGVNDGVSINYSYEDPTGRWIWFYVRVTELNFQWRWNGNPQVFAKITLFVSPGAGVTSFALQYGGVGGIDWKLYKVT
jgi:hypothetical protein